MCMCTHQTPPQADAAAGALRQELAASRHEAASLQRERRQLLGRAAAVARELRDAQAAGDAACAAAAEAARQAERGARAAEARDAAAARCGEGAHTVQRCVPLRRVCVCHTDVII